jgi:DNA-binding CsgD family transcriptional regulator
MRRLRRTFTAQFRAEVALAALKGDKTPTELARVYGLRPSQVNKLRQHAIEHLPELFLDEGPSQKSTSFHLQVKHQAYANLTPREREVLEIVSRGLNQRDAGELLGISRRTVEVHKRRIMGKLNVDSVAELIRFVLKGDRPKRELQG